MEQGTVFQGFSEAPIRFAPTFRRVVGLPPALVRKWAQLEVLAQCYTLEDRRNCSTSPEAPPGAATASDEKTFLGQSWTQWLWLLTWLFAGLAVVACIKSNLISPVGSKPVIVGLTVIVFAK